METEIVFYELCLLLPSNHPCSSFLLRLLHKSKCKDFVLCFLLLFLVLAGHIHKCIMFLWHAIFYVNINSFFFGFILFLWMKCLENFNTGLEITPTTTYGCVLGISSYKNECGKWIYFILRNIFNPELKYWTHFQKNNSIL